MAAAVLSKLQNLDVLALALASRGVQQGTSALAPGRSVIPLDWPELERVLPDHGLPRAVVELAMPMGSPSSKQGAFGAMRGGATTIALSAIRSAHEADPQAWCAWITPEGTPMLYAPQVAQAGVDLDRLLVVRPDPASLARTVVKVAASGAFDLVVVDALAGLDGKLSVPAPHSFSRSTLGLSARSKAPAPRRGVAARRVEGAVVVRKLALASEEKGTGFILLTNMYAPRAVPWPVALRLEVERRPEAIAVRVTKDRSGRAHSTGSSAHVVRLAS